MKAFSISVKEKGRIVLPVALQRAGKFGPGDTLIAQLNDDGDVVLVNRRRVLEKLWTSIGSVEDSGAVDDLKNSRTQGEIDRRKRLASSGIHDEDDLLERVSALLGRDES